MWLLDLIKRFSGPPPVGGLPSPTSSTLSESVLSPEQKLVLESMIPGYTDPSQVSDRLRSLKGNLSDYHVAAAFGALYTKVSRDRMEQIRQIEEIRTFYVVDAILNQLTEDALAPDVTTGNIIDITSDNPEINKEILALDERYRFDQLAVNITPELIAHGEYTLSTRVKTWEDGFGSKEGFGLTDLLDDVEQGFVVAITKEDGDHGYMKLNDMKGNLDIFDTYAYVKFCLPARKIRIDMHRELELTIRDKKKLDNIPRFIRVGKSMVFPIISKLKELELLEQLVPATKLAKLAGGTLMGVQVPAGYNVQEAMNAAREIEGMVNKKVGIDTANQLINIENIMSSAGRLKVIPVFGDKGQLQRFDYKQDEPDDLLSSVKDVREVICSSIGVPYEIMFGADGDSKSGLLKRYARYLRRLKNIQRAVLDGLQQIVFIHLANKGIEFKPADIKFRFRNHLVEIDNLDRLEFLDGSISMLTNIKNFVTDLSTEESPFKPYIDLSGFLKFLNDQLRLVGLDGVVKKVKAGPETIEDDTSFDDKMDFAIKKEDDLEEPEDSEEDPDLKGF